MGVSLFLAFLWLFARFLILCFFLYVFYEGKLITIQITVNRLENHTGKKTTESRMATRLFHLPSDTFNLKMQPKFLHVNLIFLLAPSIITKWKSCIKFYNSAGVPTRHDLNGLEYPLTSTSDFKGRGISGGVRKVRKLDIFCVYLGACIGEIQARYYNGFNVYSKRKFHMDVKFTIKKRLLKSTWKACENYFGCAKCSHVF